MTEGWARVPDRLIRSDASDRAVRLYALLDRCGAGRGEAWPSRAYLAAQLGCSLASVDRALGELRAAGWLVVRRKRWATSRYALSTGVHNPVDDTPPRPRPHAP